MQQQFNCQNAIIQQFDGITDEEFAYSARKRQATDEFMMSASKYDNEIEYEDESLYATFGCLDVNTMHKNDLTLLP